jgi:hypothetical protein
LVDSSSAAGPFGSLIPSVTRVRKRSRGEARGRGGIRKSRATAPLAGKRLFTKNLPALARLAGTEAALAVVERCNRRML